MLPRLVSRTTESGAGMAVTEKVQEPCKVAIRALTRLRSPGLRLSDSLRANIIENVNVYILLDAPSYQRSGSSRK